MRAVVWDGRTDKRSDFNRLSAGIRSRVENKKKVTVLMGQ
jgi:hypothetical protein